MNSTETKDEVNFLDADTWPEILRQHLEDAHGKEGYKARELALVRRRVKTKKARVKSASVGTDCVSTEESKTDRQTDKERLSD